MNNMPEEVKVSSKYQVVIPKAARKKMGITDKGDYTLRVKNVRKYEITLEVVPDWREFIGLFPQETNAVKLVRNQRDTEWE